VYPLRKEMAYIASMKIDIYFTKGECDGNVPLLGVDMKTP